MMAEERYECNTQSVVEIRPQHASILRACLIALSSNSAKVEVSGRTSIHVTPGITAHEFTYNPETRNLHIFHLKDKNLHIVLRLGLDCISATGTLAGYELARGFNLQQSNLDLDEKKYRVQRAKQDNHVRCDDLGVTSDNFFVSEEPTSSWTENSVAVRIDSHDCLQFWMKVLITW